MSLLLAAQRALTVPGWAKDELSRKAQATPSHDLRFADNKSLVDATTGQNLVSFTRASSGTYVDSQGVIRTATTNLLLQSADISNAYWVKAETTVTANAITAPDGTTTAGKLVESINNTQHTLASAAISWAGNTQYTATFFAKAGERSKFDILLGTAANWVNSERVATFDLASGTVFLSPNSPAVASITPFANNWFRCRVTATTTATPSASSVFIRMCDNTGLASYQGIANYGLYLWGAQLEQSSTVGEYIPTTSTINSAPRFDHNPTTGESLGLLVEESRTNLLLYSACDSNWPTGGFGTPTYSLGLSALGVFSGVQVASGGQNWHSIYRSGISLTASTVYAFTLFYRAGTSGRVRLTFRNNTSTTETIISGAVGSLAVGGSFAGTATLLSQYLCSDGLTYVVTGTFTPNGTSADHWYRIGPDSTTSGQTVIALGAQLEAGAFPTSYIPTTTATVTRSADVASISGSNFSSWYRQDEGTMFAEVANVRGTGPTVTVRATTAATERMQFVNANGQTAVIVGGVAQVLFGGNTARQSFAYRANDFAQQRLGVSLETDVNGSVPTVDYATIGRFDFGGGDVINGTIRRLTYWPQRLSNSTLQSITQ